MVFGRSKKNEDAEEAQKSVLFSTKKSTRPSFTQTNPYATAQADDPYAASPSNPPPPPYGNSDPSISQFRAEKTPVPPGGYGGGPQSGPSQRFAGSSNPGYSGYSGYNQGQDRYGASSAPPAAGGSRYGSGGYGGLGAAPRAENADTDSNRDALFGNAPTKLADRGYQNNDYSSQSQANKTAVSEWESGRGSSYGASEQTSTPYEQRVLSPEEQENEDVDAVKNEIRFIKQQDVSSTRNALRIAAQAEETGRTTLERLGAQGERIHNTERNLDLASNQNRLAAEKARELKTLNRSMFAVHVNNPFTSAQRTAERENAVLEQARKDREERDATRNAAWSSDARARDQARRLNKPTSGTKAKSSLAERSKYQFEADSEDEDMENEIDSNLDLLHGAAGRLKQLGLAMGEEVDAQNRHIERIGGKVDRVDDEIALNRSRLDRIR